MPLPRPRRRGGVDGKEEEEEEGEAYSDDEDDDGDDDEDDEKGGTRQPGNVPHAARGWWGDSRARETFHAARGSRGRGTAWHGYAPEAARGRGRGRSWRGRGRGRNVEEAEGPTATEGRNGAPETATVVTSGDTDPRYSTASERAGVSTSSPKMGSRHRGGGRQRSRGGSGPFFREGSGRAKMLWKPKAAPVAVPQVVSESSTPAVAPPKATPLSPTSREFVPAPVATKPEGGKGPETGIEGSLGALGLHIPRMGSPASSLVVEVGSDAGHSSDLEADVAELKDVANAVSQGISQGISQGAPRGRGRHRAGHRTSPGLPTPPMPFVTMMDPNFCPQFACYGEGETQQLVDLAQAQALGIPLQGLGVPMPTVNGNWVVAYPPDYMLQAMACAAAMPGYAGGLQLASGQPLAPMAIPFGPPGMAPPQPQPLLPQQVDSLESGRERGVSRGGLPPDTAMDGNE